MKKLLVILSLLIASAFATTYSADTQRVIRGGDLVKTTAPRMSSFMITGSTANATVTTANLWVVISLKDGTTANMLIYKP